MMAERRANDLEIERRMATLEQQQREGAAWRDKADGRFDGIDDKLDQVLRLVERVAGGWWALAKAAAVIVTAVTTVGGGLWWAVTHLAIRPAIVLLILLATALA